MAVTESAPAESQTPGLRPTKQSLGSRVVNVITSTDHKVIGYMYLTTAFIFFMIGGLLAVLMRVELWEPGMLFQSMEQYNQFFTMHGTIMLFLFATPLFTAFANIMVPLQIGAADVAFPKLNMFSYWLFVLGGLLVVAGFLTPTGAASFGWTAYTPLSTEAFSPGAGGDLWIVGLIMTGFGTIFGSVNFIASIIAFRAPGMTMFRVPVFSWTVLITSLLVLMAFPVLAAALFGLLFDRVLAGNIYDPHAGGSLLWQHLFWFFGHPEVYIIALPFFGITSEILPVFARKPIFGYKTLVYATIAIAALSISVWAHHMFTSGGVMLDFFSLMTMLIAVPTGVKFVNWIGTIWRGKLTFETPMLWTIGFMLTFVLGGITGVILASPAMDLHVHDTYFVVAHFHYVVFGTVVFTMYAGIHYWWPKWTGRMLDETLGKITFWLTFIGFHTTFLIQHFLGVQGMPRRYPTWMPEDGFTFYNQISTIGAFILATSTLFFLYNVYKTMRGPITHREEDPWGFGNSLEWATPSPIPRHNFLSLPRIRSERPAFDLHHPEVTAMEQAKPAEQPLNSAVSLLVADERTGPDEADDNRTAAEKSGDTSADGKDTDGETN